MKELRNNTEHSLSKFKDDIQATEYGISIRGNEPSIRCLSIYIEEVQKELNRVKKESDLNVQAHWAFQLELAHIALEEAKQENKAIAPAHASGCYGER